MIRKALPLLSLCTLLSCTEVVCPNDVQVRWADSEIGVILHLDMASFISDYSFEGDVPDASVFNPELLDTDQWLETAAALGAEYAVMVAKHGSGFCLWPTEVHDYSVKSTPWRNGQGDIIRDFVESCRKYGIKPGIYASTGMNQFYKVWDHTVEEDAVISQEEYRAAVMQQLTELWTWYGPLFEIWFDGGVLSPELGGPDVLALANRLQPEAVAFQGPYGFANLVRWVGNEEGTAPEPCWATADSTTRSDGSLAIEGLHGDPYAPYWCPGESDFTLRWNSSYLGGWFWRDGEDHMMFTLDELMHKYATSVGRNTNMLVGLVVDNRGLIPDADVKRIREFGEEIRRCYGTPLESAEGRGRELGLKLDTPALIDRAVIQEDIRYGERILSFKVEARTSDGNWITFAEGESIGHKRIVHFPEVMTDHVRLSVTDAKRRPVIRNFSIYEKL